MEKNITYLFGAGASASALPIVSRMPGRLKEFYKVLDNRRADIEKGALKNHREYLPWVKQLASDVGWLFRELADIRETEKGPKMVLRHSSVDTLAKIYRLRKDESSLNRLKAALCLFFAYEQSEKKFDIRYDSFFASILGDSLQSFPPNVKIVSWNYDSQFEIAFKSIRGEGSLEQIQRALNVVSKQATKSAAASGFSIFKLNGSTNFLEHTTTKCHHTLCDDPTLDHLDSICDSYKLLRQPGSMFYAGLSFAWEEDLSPDAQEQSIIDLAREAIKDTNILVVGYSLPFFNRKIDSALFGQTGMPKLKRVYIQDKKTAPIIERFLALRDDINAEHIDGYDQFYLPGELNVP